MNPKVQEALENFSRELQPKLQGIEQKLVEQENKTEEKCFDQARDDADAFARCMSKSVKKLERAGKDFGFRLAFFQNQTFKCFTEVNNGRGTVEDCKAAGRANIESYIDRLYKDISN
eukprot:TRINITY_DN749_c0_g2_i1.p1 TRINITY_DN749_c0_g2~~TRINITY_DN749_c0_g2_i1.p1  ORF type:complete len:117 (+),score=37.71 TRINITY_DN749_c0_g2_i1:101-451(+)